MVQKRQGIEPDDETAGKINAIIAERTKYGEHLERYYAKGTLMRWSNAAARWNIMPATRAFNAPFIYCGEKVIRLDANELVVNVPRKVVEQLNKAGKLKMLPLHANSTEAMSGK